MSDSLSFEDLQRIVKGEQVSPEALKKIEESPLADVAAADKASLLPAIGGIVGGVVLSRAPVGKIPGVGPMIEAAVSKAPRIAQELFPSLFGSTIGTGAGVASEQYLKGETNPEQYRKELIENAVYDVGGNLTFKLVGQTYKLGKDLYTKFKGGSAKDTAEKIVNLRNAQQFLADSKIEGATLTPGVIDPFKAEVELMTRGGLTGSRYIQASEAVKDAVIKGIDDFSKTFQNSDIFKKNIKTPDFADEFGISVMPSATKTAGTTFREVHKEGEKALKESVKPLYAQLDKANIPVNMSGIRAQATEELKKLNSQIPTKESNSAKQLLQTLSNLPDAMRWSSTFDSLSNFKSIARDLKNAAEPSTETAMLYNKYAALLDKSLESSAKGLQSDLYKTYRTASDTYKEGINVLYSDTLQAALANKNNEAIVESLVKGETELGDVYKVSALIAKQTKGKIPQSKILEDLRAGYADKMFKTPELMVDWIKKIEADPAFAKTQKTFFTPKQYDFLSSMGTAAKEGIKESSGVGNIGARQIGAFTLLGSGATALSISQGTTLDDSSYNIINRLGTTAIGLGTTLILTPRMVAHLLTDPTAMDAMLKLKDPRIGKRVWGAATSKVVDSLNNAGYLNENYLDEVNTSFGIGVPRGQRPSPNQLPNVLPTPKAFTVQDLEKSLVQ